MSPSSPEEVSFASQNVSPKTGVPGLTLFNSNDLPLATSLAVTATVPPAEDNLEPHSPTNSTASSEETNSTKTSWKHACSKCEAVFSEALQLERHNKFHGANLEFECHFCDFSAPSSEELSDHQNGHHNRLQANPQTSSIHKTDDDEIVDVENVENTENTF